MADDWSHPLESGSRVPQAVLRYKLEIQKGDRRRVTHLIHEPHLPPSAPPRHEIWESGRRPIGKGGQGEVYLQTCTSAGPQQSQCRALKVIRFQDGDQRRRYVREIEIMGRFSDERLSRDCKFFVKMLGYYFSTKGYLCLAMEYCPAGDLHSYLTERGPLPEPDTQEVMSQVLQGLTIMHNANVAHRDIKPQNILIHQCPTTSQPGPWWVKLADFGISRRVDVTNSTINIGTYSYMPPDLLEALSNKIKLPDTVYKAADIWAVGVMAFFILTANGGFRTWRRLQLDADACEPLPNHPEVSQTARKFIFRATVDPPDERLVLDKTWLALHMEEPETQVGDDDNESTYSTSSSSSSSSSSNGSFSTGMEERSSLSTRRSDTTVAAIRSGQNETVEKDQEPEEPTILPTSKTEIILKEVVEEVNKEVVQKVDKEEDREARDGCNDSTVDSVVAVEPSLMTAISNLTDQQISGRSGRKALMASIWLGDVDAVGLLIDRGVDIRSRCDDTLGLTPLLEAARHGSVDMVGLLLENGADVDGTDNRQRTALCEAASEGRIDVLRCLVGYGANVEASDKGGWTAFHFAVSNGHLKVLQYLKSQGADWEARIPGGIAPFHHAARAGSLPVAKYISSLGWDPRSTDDGGYTAIHHAASQDQLFMIQYLEGSKVDPFAAAADGLTPLHCASWKGHQRTVKYLLSRGADPLAREKSGLSVIHFAAGGGSLDLVQYLVEHEIVDPATTMDASARTALHHAAGEGRLDVMEYLLSQGGGCDPNMQDARGRTALYHAAKRGHAEAVMRLLGRGADPMATDRSGRTMLHAAADGGDVNMFSYLMHLGVDIAAVNTTGLTAVDQAARIGRLEVIKHLVGPGGDLADLVTGVLGTDLLQCAARGGHMDVVKYVVGVGADPMHDAGRGRRYCPLSCAAERGHWDVAAYLEGEMMASFVRRQPVVLLDKVSGPAHMPRDRPLSLQSIPDSVFGINLLGPYTISMSHFVYIPGGQISPRVLLRAGSSILAVGGELRPSGKNKNEDGGVEPGEGHDEGSDKGPGMMAFQVAHLARPSTDRSSDDDEPARLHGLHVYIPSQGPRLFLFYAPDGLDHSSELNRFVWDKMDVDDYDETADHGDSLHFRLFRCAQPLSTLAQASLTTRDIIARLTIRPQWNRVKCFTLNFRQPLRPRDYLAAVITALTIWVNYCKGRLGKDGIR